MHIPEVKRAIILQERGTILSLLSVQEGRIEKCVNQRSATSRFLYRGSILTYQNSRHFFAGREIIENVELELCSTQLASKNIYLLHQVLELCHFFIPLGSQACTTFYFLLELFENYYRCTHSPFYVKRVLCKLFVLLGIYPEEVEIQFFAHKIYEMPIDNLLAAPLELKSEELMNKWLAWCIEMHPKGKFFKAMPLLLKK